MFVPKCDRGIATFAAALREMEPLEFQFDFQTLVINRLVETAAFVLIDFKARPDNGVALILVN